MKKTIRPEDVKLGMVLWNSVSFEANRQTIDAYAAAGFDSAWVIDHLLGNSHPDTWKDLPASAMQPDPDMFLDHFSVAAILAGRTKLQLGSAIINLNSRRPIDMARAALTIHHESPTGFIFGVGTGTALNLIPFGYEFKKKVSLFEQNIAELRCLLDTGRMPSGVGRIGLPLESKVGKVKIWIAGHAERMRNITGRFGDGWMTSGISPETLVEHYAEVVSAAESVGRPPPTISFCPYTLAGPSRGAIAAALEKYPMAKMFMIFAPATLWKKYGLEHPMGPNAQAYADGLPHALDPAMMRALAPRIPFEMFEEFVLCGNGEEMAAKLRPYIDAGVEHFIIANMTGMAFAPPEAMGLLSEYVKLRTLLRQPSQ